MRKDSYKLDTNWWDLPFVEYAINELRNLVVTCKPGFDGRLADIAVMVGEYQALSAAFEYYICLEDKTGIVPPEIGSSHMHPNHPTRRQINNEDEFIKSVKKHAKGNDKVFFENRDKAKRIKNP